MYIETVMLLVFDVFKNRSFKLLLFSCTVLIRGSRQRVGGLQTIIIVFDIHSSIRIESHFVPHE